MRLLLVEDDQAIARQVQTALVREGFAVDWVASGQEALRYLQDDCVELVVLDLGLPDVDGMDVLKQLRQKRPQLPVLILTARDALESKVSALDLGADDYLVKPFAMPELLARLRVMARHMNQTNSSEIQVGTVILDVSAHRLSVDEQVVSLARREFMILRALMENQGRVLTKDALENKLYAWDEEIASNTIEVYVSHLRKKLPKAFIQTIRGVGYTIPGVADT